LLSELSCLDASSACCGGSSFCAYPTSFDSAFYSEDVGGSTVLVCSSAFQDFVHAITSTNLFSDTGNEMCASGGSVRVDFFPHSVGMKPVGITTFLKHLCLFHDQVDIMNTNVYYFVVRHLLYEHMPCVEHTALLT